MKLATAQKELIKKIKLLKEKTGALVLCHNYQRPEIYAVADFIGDSLELCKKARNTKAKIIVFCGVYFMAESAAILNPGKKVLIPTKEAGCALSKMITAEGLIKMKKKYPDAAVLCYVNSSADVKAESDVLCTSANAVQIAAEIPQKQILFVPDKNLAAFVAKSLPKKEIIAWDGFCPIHQRLSVEHLAIAREHFPNAKIIAHPECTESILSSADYVASTSGMIKVAKESSAEEFICTTECGMIERMSKEVPNKKFHTLCSVCFDMKKITLENLGNCLLKKRYEVKIPAEVQKNALKAFERMFNLTA